MSVVIPVLLCALVVAITVGVIRLLSRRKTARGAERATVVGLLARQSDIEFSFDEPTSTFRGTARGRLAHYRWHPRSGAAGGADGVEWWTDASVQVPIGTLAMDIRPAGVLALVAGRRETLVKTGDAAFDAAFLVEAAPVDVARELLDAEVRAWFLRWAPARVRTTDDGFYFEKRGRLGEDKEAIGSILDGLGRLADRATGAAESALAKRVDEPGGPYRASPDASSALQTRRRHGREVEDLRATWRQRDRRTIVLNVIFVTVFVLGVIFLLVASLR